MNMPSRGGRIKSLNQLIILKPFLRKMFILFLFEIGPHIAQAGPEKPNLNSSDISVHTTI